MVGFSTIKLVICALLVAAFLAMGVAASHYHSAWVKAQVVIAQKDVELKSAMAAVNACSDATDALKRQSEAKSEAVRKAQQQAAVAAKASRAAVDKILSWEPQGSDRCAAIEKLHRDYKAQVSGGK